MEAKSMQSKSMDWFLYYREIRHERAATPYRGGSWENYWIIKSKLLNIIIWPETAET